MRSNLTLSLSYSLEDAYLEVEKMFYKDIDITHLLKYDVLTALDDVVRKALKIEAEEELK